MDIYEIFILNLVFTAFIYSAPIAVYRFLIKGEPVDRKKAKKITIIYGIISFVVMGVILMEIVDSTPGTSILIWGYLNYRMLVGKKEASHTDNQKKAEGSSEENKHSLSIAGETPIKDNSLTYSDDVMLHRAPADEDPITAQPPMEYVNQDGPYVTTDGKIYEPKPTKNFTRKEVVIGIIGLVLLFFLAVVITVKLIEDTGGTDYYMDEYGNIYEIDD